MSFVHNRIAVFRAEMSMSRKALADLVGVNPQTIGYLERGDYAPSVELALKLAAVFKAPVEALFSLKPFVPLGRTLKEQRSS
jgi:putative transcriptional regulator